jgi:hypothetical protein
MLYELKVVVNRIDPPIWRLIQVPPRTSLRRLHKILQVAMGWTNSHLHMFKVDGREYGEPDPEYDFEVLDEAKLTLEKIFAGGKKSFQYEYDMGDSWLHDITLKRQIESEDIKAGCIAGARACPPEDCGGPMGYYDLLVALSDSEHEDHESMLEWVGGKFDPNAFDPAAVDRALKRLR